MRDKYSINRKQTENMGTVYQEDIDMLRFHTTGTRIKRVYLCKGKHSHRNAYLYEYIAKSRIKLVLRILKIKILQKLL